MNAEQEDRACDCGGRMLYHSNPHMGWDQCDECGKRMNLRAYNTDPKDHRRLRSWFRGR